MKKLFFASLLLLSATVYSQKNPKVLIADETTVQAGEKNFKINTCNEKIASLMFRKYEPKFVAYYVRYKKDRLGRYRDYTITLPNEEEQTVKTFLKSL